jgi:hypothetical protein
MSLEELTDNELTHLGWRLNHTCVVFNIPKDRVAVILTPSEKRRLGLAALDGFKIIVQEESLPLED